MITDWWNRPTVRQYAVVILLNLTVLSTGFNMAWPSPALVKLSNTTLQILDQNATQTEIAWIASAPTLIGLLGNFLAIFLVGTIGRKYTLFISTLPRILCFTILLFATNVWSVIVARLLSGFSDSVTMTVVPVYAAELASTEVRGGLGLILQISCTLGIVILLSVGPYLTYATMNTVVLIVCVFTAIPSLILPDSPFYVYSKKQDKISAMKILTFLRGSEASAAEEIKEYDASSNNQTNWRDIFKSPSFRKAFFVVVFLGFSAQLCGFIIVQTYLQTILLSTKSTLSAELSSVIIGCIQLFACLCAIFVVDRFDRKAILAVSIVGLAIGMFGLGLFFKLVELGYEVVGLMNVLPLTSLIFIVYFNCGGLGAIIWPLISELFDGPTRAIGLSTFLVISMLVIFTLIRFFPSFTIAYGASTAYWIFSVNCIILLLFILYFLPETKGRSFAQIQEALGSKRSEKDRNGSS